MADPVSNEEVRKAVAPLREEIRVLAGQVKELKGLDGPVTRHIANPDDRGEAMANVMLAYRHLQDARFRLGLILGE